MPRDGGFCIAVGLLLLLMPEGSYAVQSGPSSGTGRQASRTPDRSNRCKDRNTYRVTGSELARQPLTLQCPKGPIVEVKDVGIMGQCRGSTPDIRMNANRCAWNNTCTIQNQGRAMDNMLPGSREVNCLGQVPDAFEIVYTCLKDKVDVYDVLGQFQSTQKAAGIARSHRLYPWTYRNGDQLGNLTFVKPRQSDMVNLWFTVHSFGVLHSDVVFLSWNDNSNRQQQVTAYRMITPTNQTFKMDNVQSMNLTFYADYTHHHSGIDGEEKGFVICFQWMKGSGRPKQGSACSNVMQPGRCQGASGPASSGNQRTTRSPTGPATHSSRNRNRPTA